MGVVADKWDSFEIVTQTKAKQTNQPLTITLLKFHHDS